jgi:hypothetical protein
METDDEYENVLDGVEPETSAEQYPPAPVHLLSAESESVKQPLQSLHRLVRCRSETHDVRWAPVLNVPKYYTLHGYQLVRSDYGGDVWVWAPGQRSPFHVCVSVNHKAQLGGPARMGTHVSITAFRPLQPFRPTSSMDTLRSFRAILPRWEAREILVKEEKSIETAREALVVAEAKRMQEEAEDRRVEKLFPTVCLYATYKPKKQK